MSKLEQIKKLKQITQIKLDHELAEVARLSQVAREHQEKIEDIDAKIAGVTRKFDETSEIQVSMIFSAESKWIKWAKLEREKERLKLLYAMQILEQQKGKASKAFGKNTSIERIAEAAKASQRRE